VLPRTPDTAPLLTGDVARYLANRYKSREAMN